MSCRRLALTACRALLLAVPHDACEERARAKNHGGGGQVAPVRGGNSCYSAVINVQLRYLCSYELHVLAALDELPGCGCIAVTFVLNP